MSEYQGFDPTRPPAYPERTIQPGITLPFKAIPLHEDDYEYYKCTVPNHHMHRTDGKRLTFVHGIYHAKDARDVEYLENEIAAGNPYLRKPNEREINMHGMLTDPRATIAKEITPAIEQRVKDELTAQLMSSMEERLSKVGIVLTDEQREELKNQAKWEAQAEEQTAEFQEAEQGIDQRAEAAGIQGTDILAKLRAAGASGLRTGNATIIPSGNTQMPGMVGTDQLPTSAESNQGGGAPAGGK